MNAGTPLSLLLIAAGGILTWGVTDNVAEIDFAAVGAILMIVGAVGLMLSLFFWSQFFGPRTVVRDRDRDTVYREEPVTYRERPNVIVERDNETRRDETIHRHV